MSRVCSYANPSGQRCSVTTEFSRVDSPGAYIIHGFGILVRVPEEALGDKGHPSVAISAEPSSLVTRISDDPWIALNRARSLAANVDLPVRF